MDQSLKTGAYRQPEHPVDPLFPERWSPRAMSGAHVDRGALMTLFEAARWAPSSGNNQPWRYAYALRSGKAWPRFLDLLVPGNRLWCVNAGALIVMASKNTLDRDGKPSPTHSFDAGSAWMSMALQAGMLGLVCHGMAGFDYALAADTIGLPAGYTVEAMCAIGHPAPAETLPEKLRDREKPSGRKSVAEFAFEDAFPAENP